MTIQSSRKRQREEATPSEEAANVLTHAVGTLLFLLAGLFLIIKAHLHEERLATLSAYIFTAPLVFQYLSSTLYHAATKPRTKRLLHLVDHLAIFILIAGTYTPILLVALNPKVSPYFTVFMWSFALAGIVYKLFLFGRYRFVSLTIYLAMGWMAIFIAKDFYETLPVAASIWILIGGLSYSIGTYFYSNRNMRYHHAIWHLFVLGGSVSHYIAIYLYVY